ncbi:hypothetical protein EIN_380910 [Entamoeba invadens IP1]|uniref:Uncharacterized protein n=1 Tax=Entamoeba invadens IP1 TaxID=370355 RepID=A0A0A1UG15_ENTIV|nr:hypothetical protein EIN_380910 [Entamoeba invadens IP1]ELP92134.1 hypothetical protein EIN_380910 [Entamoeba invadens IP1]|eukprot:XP_004258905.1 hypothetical protein EIN_380910 [Entamoeba invadens IP1]
MSKPQRAISTTEVKRESKSFEAVQQAVLIALLNYLGYSIEIKHPERLAAKTIQFLIVNELFYDGKSLGFGEDIESVCNERYEGEKNTAPNAKKVRQTRRHKDINRSALTFNRLLKLVEDHGYTVKRRYTKSSFKTFRMEKITDILLNDKIIIDTAQMNDIGKSVNTVITKTFKKGPYKTTLIEVKNEVIMNILQQVPYFKNSKTKEIVEQPEQMQFDPVMLPQQNYFKDIQSFPKKEDIQGMYDTRVECSEPIFDKIYDITNERMKELCMPMDFGVKKEFVQESGSAGSYPPLKKEQEGRTSPTYQLMFKPVDNDPFFQPPVQPFVQQNHFQYQPQQNVYV